LNRNNPISQSDVISMGAVRELVANGRAKIINGIVFLTDKGKKTASHTYTGKKRWLKKEKRGKLIVMSRGLHRRNLKKSDTENAS